MRRTFLAAVVALASARVVSLAEAAPQITSVSPENGSTAGGTIITITGTGFGAAGNAVTIGGRLCLVTADGPAQIECALPEGSGASRPIRVIDDLGVASPPYPFAYSPPAITSVTAASAPAAGGFPITIYGEHFGAASTDRRVSVNGSAAGSCAADPITPHSQVVCTAPKGAGHAVPVEITVDGQSSPPSLFSYDPPAITAVTPTRASAAGGVLITITGTNFGDTAAVMVGGSSCPVDSSSDARVVCELPPNGGAPPDVVVIAAGQVSNGVPFSYQQVASKCDAAKLKAAAGYAKCLGTAEANAAKKGVEPTAEALTKCDDKMAAACAKAELKLTDCSQVGTCDALAAGTGRKGWDGLIYGNTR
jgi:hypothetical protein